MEQVFPVGSGSSASPTNLKYKGGEGSALEEFKIGIIEKVFEPGNFIVALDGGLKVRANGSGSLKKGSKVRIRLLDNEPIGVEKKLSRKNVKSIAEDGIQISAVIPLAFGGKKAKARLEVYVERQNEGARDLDNPATYFVFSVQTDSVGEIQWSVHMKGKQVSLQVFSQLGEMGKEKLGGMVREIEESLKNRGFTIMSPTVFLTRPFQIPPGFRLNVTG